MNGATCRAVASLDPNHPTVPIGYVQSRASPLVWMVRKSATCDGIQRAGLPPHVGTVS
jgi:hypothetical protein